MSAQDGLCDGKVSSGWGCGNPARFAVKREDSRPNVDLSTGCGKHLPQLVLHASRGKSRVIVTVVTS